MAASDIFRKSQSGVAAVIVCLLLPVIIAVAGLCIDGVYLLLNEARLSSATKYAAISATAYYTEEDGQIILMPLESQDAAYRVLQSNYDGARITDYTINKNECTLTTEADVNFLFIRIVGINETTISEIYSARRNKMQPRDGE